MKINLPSIIWASLWLKLVSGTGTWKVALQRPVEISQVFTAPFASLEIAIPALACRLTERIEGNVGEVGTGSVAAGSVDKVPICQNLIELSMDAEMREEGEENTRE
jgi:hypothetical protein